MSTNEQIRAAWAMLFGAASWGAASETIDLDDVRDMSPSDAALTIHAHAAGIAWAEREADIGEVGGAWRGVDGDALPLVEAPDESSPLSRHDLAERCNAAAASRWEQLAHEAQS